MKRTCIFSSLAFALAFICRGPGAHRFACSGEAGIRSRCSGAKSTCSPAPSLATTIQAKLPSGVEDIVKLSKAQIGEEVIAGFIRNSGSTYSLSPKDVIYLRDQGVSDRIVKTMLEHRTAPEMTSDQNQNQPVELANSAPSPIRHLMFSRSRFTFPPPWRRSRLNPLCTSFPIPHEWLPIMAPLAFMEPPVITPLLIITAHLPR